MNHDKSLRDHLVKLMQGGQAHCTLDEAVADMPKDAMGETLPGMPHSAWQLLEHLRLAQRDILDFCRDPKYKAPHWPEDYWPGKTTPPSAKAWASSVQAIKADLQAMCELVSDPKVDLFTSIPWGDDQTILREALLIADHNAYHMGQIVALRRVLGAWTD
jgi:uncharacterized damage-inducible protein DinB